MIIREVSASDDAAMRPIRVLLVDRDPMSREFLITMLGTNGIEVGTLDEGDSVSPADRQVIIVASAPSEPGHVRMLRTLAAAGERVLVLGVQWTQESIRSALEAGASGCMVKSVDVVALATAISAVASGHVVISPELMSTYVGVRQASAEPSEPAPSSGLDARDVLDKLTTREIEVLDLLGEGLSTGETAERLGVTFATVKSHVSHVITKLGVRNRVQAVLIAKELRLAELAQRRDS